MQSMAKALAMMTYKKRFRHCRASVRLRAGVRDERVLVGERHERVRHAQQQGHPDDEGGKIQALASFFGDALLETLFFRPSYCGQI